jgi:hypothetical protein
MTLAHFTSLAHAEVINVVFVDEKGGETTLRMQVDSGFVGRSSFVLPDTYVNLGQGDAPDSTAVGALRGVHRRVVVSVAIPALAYRTSGLAILAKPADLKLPQGVDGMAGLTFLRAFHRWGAEKDQSGRWRFFLETE